MAHCLVVQMENSKAAKTVYVKVAAMAVQLAEMTVGEKAELRVVEMAELRVERKVVWMVEQTADWMVDSMVDLMGAW